MFFSVLYPEVPGTLTASEGFLLAKLKVFLLKSEPILVGIITMRGKIKKAKCLYIKFQEYKL